MKAFIAILIIIQSAAIFSISKKINSNREVINEHTHSITVLTKKLLER